MVRADIDYPALKLEFYESDFVELAPFIDEKFGLGKGPRGGSQKIKMKGWAEDKRKWRQVLLDKAQKRAEETTVDAWADTLKNVDVARRNGLNVIARVLGNADILKQIKSPKDCAKLVPILRQLKHEAGESDADDPSGTSFTFKIGSAKKKGNTSSPQDDD